VSRFRTLHERLIDSAFRLEAFARICVSGLLLDPDVPVSTLFTSAFTPYHEIPNNSTVNINSGLSHQPSIQSQTPLSIIRRLQLFTENLSRPFVLRSHSQAWSQATTNGYATSNHDRPDMTLNHHVSDRVGDDHNHHPLTHEHAHSTYLSEMLRNDRPEPLSLPFQLSVIQAHNKTQRNMPYLRNSWNRIDFVAIFGFWTSFVLATVGVERGTYHIGIFRALSVLRTARLLTITSGTTVSSLIRNWSSFPDHTVHRLSCIRSRLPDLCSQTSHILFFLQSFCSRTFTVFTQAAHFFHVFK
jgi:voltage-dependent calcium channel